jgi:hypothetical protein
MLTLSGLVEQLTADEDDRYRVSRKIQNWVTAGLVRPVGGYGKGRGVHRLFDRHELHKIAVLLELEQYQLPWNVLIRLAGIFDAHLVRKHPVTRGAADHRVGRRSMPDKLAAVLDQAIAGSAPAYLLMLSGKEGQVIVSDNLRTAGKSRSAVIVNLTEVLRQFQ